MSGIRFTMTTTEVVLPANTAKTGLQIITPTSHHRIIGCGFGVYFDSTSVNAAPGWIAIQRQTSIGTMTGLSGVKLDGGVPETLQTSAAWNASAEPTGAITGLIKRVQVHPQAGYEYIWPMGKELPIKGGESIGIVCTMTDTVNAIFFFEGEE